MKTPSPQLGSSTLVCEDWIAQFAMNSAMGSGV
jgi:hypothetical protein